MTREDHLRAIHVTGFTQVGKRMVVVMLCAGPDCAGAQMFARLTVADVLARANTHIDEMDAIAG